MFKMVSIFIVEDELSLQLIYKNMFGYLGFQVVDIASNGRDAVKKFESFVEKPDIIIMDYRLPIKNGIDAAKQILEIDKKSKIIFVTADKNIRDEALTIGATSFKEKPCPINLLKNNIIKALKA